MLVVVLFLASQLGSLVTGRYIPVYGAHVMWSETIDMPHKEGTSPYGV